MYTSQTKVQPLDVTSLCSQVREAGILGAEPPLQITLSVGHMYVCAIMVDKEVSLLRAYRSLLGVLYFYSVVLKVAVFSLLVPLKWS